MKAADIMTGPVVTVTADTPVHEVAALLSQHGISAVPVLEAGLLVGIVSEADLMRRHELGTDCALGSEPWWLQIFRPGYPADEYVRSHAVRVRDIMTREVATIAPETSLTEVTTLFEKHGVKRLPVVQDGRVCGIVSRADLVKALAGAGHGARTSASPDDTEIRALLLAELERQPWWRSDLSSVTVEHGVVTYRGATEFESQRAAARVAAESIPGVRRVEDQRVLFRDLPSMV